MKKIALIVAALALFTVWGCGTKTVIVQSSPKPAVTVTAQPSPAPSQTIVVTNGVTVDSRVSTAAAMFRAAYGRELLVLTTHSMAQQNLAISSWNAAHDYFNSFPTTDNNTTQQRYLIRFAHLVRDAITTNTYSLTATYLQQANEAWAEYQNYVASISQT
jgi:hypothetical protein